MKQRLAFFLRQHQACRVLRCGTITFCTVQTVLAKIRRIFVIVTPSYIKVEYGKVLLNVMSHLVYLRLRQGLLEYVLSLLSHLHYYGRIW
jgi:hypothetical protein